MKESTSITPVSENKEPSGESTKYAGFWRRYFAYTIDMMIIGIVNASIGFSFMFGFKDGQAFAFIPSLILSAGYFAYFWSKQNGQTLGNRILAIKVVKEDGNVLDPMTGVVRYLGYLVSGAVFCLGFLWSIWDTKKQGWHDKIAKTLVLETEEKPKKGLVVLIFGLQFLLFLFILGGIFAFIFFIASVAEKDPKAMQGMMKTFQEEIAKQDPDSEFAKSLNEALEIDQTAIDRLASNVFDEVNDKREAMQVPMLVEQSKMCAYAQRRLTQLTELGKHDDGQGFYEDMGNPEIAQAYFAGYGNIRTHVYQLSSVLPDAVEVVDFWHGDGTESIVTDAVVDDGCIRGNPQNLVIVAAEKL